LKSKKIPADCPFRESELRVLPFIIHGYTDIEIGELSPIEAGTAKIHRVNMMNVTGCKNVAQLSALCIKKGWASFNPYANLKPLRPRKGAKDKFLP